MTTNGTDIASIEAQAYRARWDDGLFDIFFGLSLIWIAVAWLWLEPVAGLAGVLPAIFVAPFVAFRKQFVEARAGYVRFNDKRRAWERRNMAVLAAFGLGVFALGIVVYLFAADGELSDLVAAALPGLISFLLGLGVLVVAAAAMIPRCFAYAALLGIGGVAAAIADSNPGAPLLPIGLVIAACGAILLGRFVSSHPARSHSEAP